MICKFEGCNRLILSRGYCNTHYQVAIRLGIIKVNKRYDCSVEGCDKKHYAKSYCKKHYTRLLLHGTIKLKPLNPNEIVQYGDICLVKIYNKKFKSITTAIIDANDKEKVCKYRWRIDSGGYVLHSRTNKNHLYLHRMVCCTPKDKVTDHINRRPLDNRKCNLRACTIAENAINSKLPKHNTSGYKGCFWEKKSKKWRAGIRKNKKTYHLGYFVDKKDAAKAYDRMAAKLWGEFAHLNFPT